MPYPEIANLRLELLQVLPKDPDAISGLADRLQKLAKYDRALTARCEFSRALQMRRLVILPLKGWKDTDARAARAALETIEQLRAAPGLAAALELACYGIERGDLSKAVVLLEQARDAQCSQNAMSQEKPIEAEAKLLPEKGPDPEPAKKAKPKTKPKALESLESLDDAELDEQTKADLDALEREVKSLKNK